MFTKCFTFQEFLKLFMPSHLSSRLVISKLDEELYIKQLQCNCRRRLLRVKRTLSKLRKGFSFQLNTFNKAITLRTFSFMQCPLSIYYSKE